MLMQVGPVTFDLKFNLDSVSRETVRDYAEKPVIGALPPLEDVGQGSERLSLAGRCLPSRMGGADNLTVLRRAQKTGLPQLVMRGDGVVYGWYVLTRISDVHAFLDARGQGQLVDMSIELQKSAEPSSGTYFSALISLLT